MLNKLIKLVFLFYSVYIYSQSNIIEYQLNMSIASDKFREFLVFNNEESYYFDYVNEDGGKINKILNEYEIRYGGKKAYRKLSNINHIMRLSYFPREGNKIYIFLDDKPKIDWKITNETKMILGYKCKKAKGEFRGRVYNVWFTTQIPISLGPWNIDGLPGLILAAADKAGVFKYESVQIINDSNLKIPKVVMDFVHNYDEKDVKNYKDFVSRENFMLKEIQEQGRASLPKDLVLTNAPSPRELMREISFEWEEPKKP